MKPIFCIDITTNKKNKEFNGKEFISKTLVPEEQAALENKEEELKQIDKKSRLPGWLRVLELIFGYYSIIVLLALLDNCGKLPIAKMWENAKGIIVSGVISVLLFLVIKLLGKRKSKTVLQNENAEEKLQVYNSYVEGVFTSLGVPENTPNVDVLIFYYAVKNDKMIVRTLGMQAVPYFNISVRMHVEDGALHIADTQNVYSFALADLKKIQRINKCISVARWNKKTPPKDPKYKPYKLALNNFGGVNFKPYYILQGERDGQEFAIYFPSYELPVFENLTGLQAQD